VTAAIYSLFARLLANRRVGNLYTAVNAHTTIAANTRRPDRFAGRTDTVTVRTRARGDRTDSVCRGRLVCMSYSIRHSASAGEPCAPIGWRHTCVYVLQKKIARPASTSDSFGRGRRSSDGVDRPARDRDRPCRRLIETAVTDCFNRPEPLSLPCVRPCLTI
jgi:hypothetical protein